MASRPNKKTSPPPRPPSIAIGDTVAAQCRKCRQATQHTVVRVVSWTPTFVTCQTCRTSHDFRTPRRLTVQDEPVQRSTAEEWEAQMATALPTKDPYDPKKHFEIGASIAHPRFGDGVVVGRSSETICEVAFECGTIRLAMATQSPRGLDATPTRAGSS